MNRLKMGKELYVVLPIAEYQRLKTLAEMPAFPTADATGAMPAVPAAPTTDGHGSDAAGHADAAPTTTGAPAVAPEAPVIKRIPLRKPPA